MSRVIGLLALATILLLAPGAAAAQTAPHCAPGQTPRFQLGFAALAAELGEVMGQPLECEHVDPASGDTVQKTSSGNSVAARAAAVIAAARPLESATFNSRPAIPSTPSSAAATAAYSAGVSPTTLSSTGTDQPAQVGV